MCLPSMIPENPNEQTVKLFRVLKILSILQLCFGIFSMFIDIWTGLYVVLGSLMMYMIVCGRNWCTCVFYIIFCFLDIYSIIFLLWSYFKDHSRIESQYSLFISINVLKIPLYLLGMYYSFLAYKELKAITIEISQGQFPDPYSSQERYDSRNVRPFSGPGYIM